MFRHERFNMKFTALAYTLRNSYCREEKREFYFTFFFALERKEKKSVCERMENEIKNFSCEKKMSSFEIL